MRANLWSIINLTTEFLPCSRLVLLLKEGLVSEREIMPTKLFLAHTDEDLSACFNAFSALRPHLELNMYLEQIRRQHEQGYQVLALSENNVIHSVSGFRCVEFLAWGKILYIDDLSTLPESRGKGFAQKLLVWLLDYAKSNSCREVHLDTGHGRHDAHRLYLKNGFKISSHHMSLILYSS